MTEDIITEVLHRLVDLEPGLPIFLILIRLSELSAFTFSVSVYGTVKTVLTASVLLFI